MNSVSSQSLTKWEHLVVDDGSNDGTAEEVSARAKADPRIRYVQRNAMPAGANACRNIGVQESSGEYLVFLDSDDVLEPACLARRVEVMRRNADLDFATFQAGIFEHTPGDRGRVMDDRLLGDDLVRFLYFEAPWQTSAPIWRRSSLQRLGLFDEALLSWQDIELHVRAIAAGLRYLRFPEVDHHIRWQFEPTKVSVEQRRSPRHLAGALDVIERLEAHVRNGPGMDWVRQRALCSLYFFVAERWLDLGMLGAALKDWRRIRKRRLGPVGLHLSGAILLVLARAGAPCTTAVRKWKGWMRLRTLPEIVPR